ncbi:hypothetical protein SS50377_26389 [Spironucleus salmonicida]|uniref:Uncharacterized protein n=1 Tax=Spironucleus salmonicida TaxID=348837 RepID=V6M395_9EUKA|nr:hypothetical protein SS50377_26389 [Spironucleus salmonicida]|eukprot:EST47744.1 Hypothetical protein SS50377_12143 [Spironucleus salmonicida]
MGNSTSQLEPEQKLQIVQNSKPDLQFEEESDKIYPLVYQSQQLAQEIKSSTLDQSISYAKNTSIYESLIQKPAQLNNPFAYDFVSVFDQQSAIGSNSRLEQQGNQLNINFSNQTIDESY